MFDEKQSAGVSNHRRRVASSVYIHARYARGDSCDDFIGDRADLFCKIFGGDSNHVPFADQNRFVAEFDSGNASHIDDCQIHTDAPDDRDKMSANENPPIVRMKAAKTVSVTYWERCDSARARGGESESVT